MAAFLPVVVPDRYFFDSYAHEMLFVRTTRCDPNGLSVLCRILKLECLTEANGIDHVQVYGALVVCLVVPTAETSIEL